MDRGRRGFPFVFYGSWEEIEMDTQVFAEIRRSDLQIYRGPSGQYPPRSRLFTGIQTSWFLLDLIIALAAAWVFAMIVDRLLFPLIRAIGKRRRVSGEAS